MNELNWLSIGITALLSFIGAFLGTYFSFVFKKKEKKYEYQLELEKRIINELKTPIYELEKNISNFRKYFQAFSFDHNVNMIIANNSEILTLGEPMSKASKEIKRIIMINTYYLIHSEAEIIVNEVDKVLSIDFFSKALDLDSNKKNKDTVKSMLETIFKMVNDYDSSKVHNTLPKLFK